MSCAKLLEFVWIIHMVNEIISLCIEMKAFFEDEICENTLMCVSKMKNAKILLYQIKTLELSSLN